MSYDPMVGAADCHAGRYSRLPSSACALSLFRWRLKDKRRGRMRPNVVNHHLLAAAVL